MLSQNAKCFPAYLPTSSLIADIPILSPPFLAFLGFALPVCWQPLYPYPCGQSCSLLPMCFANVILLFPLFLLLVHMNCRYRARIILYRAHNRALQTARMRLSAIFVLSLHERHVDMNSDHFLHCSSILELFTTAFVALSFSYSSRCR
jgi:hypothetical protein